MSMCRSMPDPASRLDEAVAQLLGHIQSTVRCTVENANGTVEREVFAVGDALQEIVNVGRQNIEDARESFEALAGSGGESNGVAELLKTQSEMATSFAGDIQRSLDRQQDATTRTNALSEKIVALSRQVAAVASQSRLLSLNASIEAARLGEHGAAFATIALEMRLLTEDVESTNMSMSDIATEMCTVLPEIEEHADTLRDRSAGFSAAMDTQLERVDAATSMLTDTVHAVRDGADKGLQAIVGASQLALSHLQFQETNAIFLNDASKEVQRACSEINAIVLNSGAGDFELTLATCEIELPSVEQGDIEAGEVMLF